MVVLHSHSLYCRTRCGYMRLYLVGATFEIWKQVKLVDRFSCRALKIYYFQWGVSGLAIKLVLQDISSIANFLKLSVECVARKRWVLKCSIHSIQIALVWIITCCKSKLLYTSWQEYIQSVTVLKAMIEVRQRPGNKAHCITDCYWHIQILTPKR